MIVSFAISTNRVGPRRWFWVRLHPDLDNLRVAAKRMRPKEDFGECYGCVHGVRRPAPSNGLAGVVRLSRTHLYGEVAAHELMHAALVVYRLNVAPSVSLGRRCGQREEQLAYIYGELYGDFVDKIHSLPRL